MNIQLFKQPSTWAGIFFSGGGLANIIDAIAGHPISTTSLITSVTSIIAGGILALTNDYASTPSKADDVLHEVADTVKKVTT